MTDQELMELAAGALPDAQKRLDCSITRRFGTGSPGAGFADDPTQDEDERLLQDMERLLDTKLPRPAIEDADSADVAFQEDTPLGRRTTVVQIRSGKVLRTIGQA